MSDSHQPTPTPQPPPLPGLTPPPRSGCLTAFMVLVGIVLLLPGVCAVLFGATALSQSHFASGLLPFIMVGLGAGFLGVMMIIGAFRAYRR
jgi:hypothetical protein